jgi:hypothetical protein
MISLSTLGLYKIAIVIYVLAVLCINLVAFFISDFYRRKFAQPAPRLGFFVAIIFGLILVCMVITREDTSSTAKIIQGGALLGAGILSMYSSIHLYLAMRKERR